MYLLVIAGRPDEHRGRDFGSIGAVSSLSGLVGAGLAGALGSHLGIVATISIDGAAYVLAGILALVGFSTLFATRLSETGMPTGIAREGPDVSDGH